MTKIDQIRRWLQTGREFTTREVWKETGGTRSEVQNAIERLHGKGELHRVGLTPPVMGTNIRQSILWRAS